MKPGIAGWAQVDASYGASVEDSRHKLEYGLHHGKNCTPVLDPDPAEGPARRAVTGGAR